MPTEIKWLGDRLRDDGNQVYDYDNNWRLEFIRQKNGKIIQYEYDNMNRLKARTKKNAIGDPGVRETFTSTQQGASGRFDIRINNTITESYFFTNHSLIRFTIGSRNYVIDTEERIQGVHALIKIFEVTQPPIGPPSRVLRQAFIFDGAGNIYIPLDPNLQPTNQATLIPRFMFMNQYYDADAGIYYMFEHQWYHPTLQVMLDHKYPFFFPPPEPMPYQGAIYPAPPWWAAPRYPRKTIGDVIGLLASMVPEEVSSRVSGGCRVLGGGIVILTVVAPADASVVGLVIGVPLGMWSVDQISTGLGELYYGAHSRTMGGRAIQSVAGNGTLGKIGTFAYDTIPGFISLPAGATRATAIERVSQALPRVQAAERAAATAQLAPKAEVVTQAVTQVARPLQVVEQVAPQVVTQVVPQAVAKAPEVAAQAAKTLQVLTPEKIRGLRGIFPTRPAVASRNLLSTTSQELKESARCMHLMEEEAAVAVQVQLSGRLQPFWGHNGLSNMTLKYMPNPATGELVAASTGFPKQLLLQHSRGHGEGEVVWWMWASGARGEEALSAVVRVTERLCLHCRHRLPTSLYQLGTRELSVGILNEGLTAVKLAVPTPGGGSQAWRAFLQEMNAVSRPLKKVN